MQWKSQKRRVEKQKYLINLNALTPSHPVKKKRSKFPYCEIVRDNKFPRSLAVTAFLIRFLEAIGSKPCNWDICQEIQLITCTQAVDLLVEVT